MKTISIDRILGFILAILTAAIFMLPFILIEQLPRARDRKGFNHIGTEAHR